MIVLGSHSYSNLSSEFDELVYQPWVSLSEHSIRMSVWMGGDSPLDEKVIVNDRFVPDGQGRLRFYGIDRLIRLAMGEKAQARFRFYYGDANIPNYELNVVHVRRTPKDYDGSFFEQNFLMSSQVIQIANGWGVELFYLDTDTRSILMKLYLKDQEVEISVGTGQGQGDIRSVSIDSLYYPEFGPVRKCLVSIGERQITLVPVSEMESVRIKFVNNYNLPELLFLKVLVTDTSEFNSEVVLVCGRQTSYSNTYTRILTYETDPLSTSEYERLLQALLSTRIEIDGQPCVVKDINTEASNDPYTLNSLKFSVYVS